ncbi:MAG: hypothetical protein KDA63_21075 [Planctomycetales bacterium]|nr:hypothetical protein [Planctomycetales bacterium]
MTFDLDELLANKVPRCLAEVTATLIEAIQSRDCSVRAFKISRSTHRVAKVLGFPLADYNSACLDNHEFISPLSLGWPDGTTTLIFDSAIHGYHGEMDSSAKLRGVGTPKRFRCGQCGHDGFLVSIQFDYWEACEDLVEDDDDEIAIEDYFCNVIIAGKCENCGTRNPILDMEV